MSRHFGNDFFRAPLSTVQIDRLSRCPGTSTGCLEGFGMAGGYGVHVRKRCHAGRVCTQKVLQDVHLQRLFGQPPGFSGEWWMCPEEEVLLLFPFLWHG